jgi:predicted nucleotide-binding protein
VARVNPQLLEKLEQKLDLSQSQVYRLIDAKVRNTHLPRPLAAIALAAERGINISRFATSEELSEIRQASRGSPSAAPAQSSSVAPTAPRRSTAARRGKATRKSGARRNVPKERDRAVFVVHGRNLKARNGLFTFLRALGLQPIEWIQAIRMTGEPSPFVGTVLDGAFREAAAIVVLFTPDDEARLKKPYRKANDPAYERILSGQARPNVLFEAGVALGRNPTSTVLVQIGELRQFSDIAGRHIMHLTNDASSRRELASKLETAGLRVDTSGTDWLREGDLTL